MSKEQWDDNPNFVGNKMKKVIAQLKSWHKMDSETKKRKDKEIAQLKETIDKSTLLPLPGTVL